MAPQRNIENEAPVNMLSKLRAPRAKSLTSLRRDHRGVRARVTGHEVVKGVNSAYVEYKVLVKHGQDSWKIRCRFSQFVQLHAQLKRAANVRLPRLPPCLGLGLLDPTADWFCDTRQEQLEQYLQQVIDRQSHLGDASEILFDFLGVKSNVPAHIRRPLASLQENATSFF